LSWQGLESLGPCRVFERTPAELVIQRAAHAEIVLTNKTVLDARTIAALPRLRYVGVLATGYNVVDLTAARSRAIPVTNVPAYSTPSVAQLTFALLLELTHQVGMHSAGVRAGRWSRSPDFCYWETPLIELSGLTLGLVGFGHVGRAVARIARGFEMRLLVHTRTRPEMAPDGLEFASLNRLLCESDVVSLHCPLTDATRHLINAAALSRMRPSAFLINTGRGPLLDEVALAAALNSGRLAGAAVDVLSTEPPAADNPLLTARNCIITPHLGWATRAARQRLLNSAVANVRAFLEGRPVNVVN
jgi:glycerate dehydrogenase